MTPSLYILVNMLADQCPICREIPTEIRVNGPDEIVLVGCGHVADGRDWLDDRT